MGKSLYSLILSDEVVRKIDTLAHRSGTNRSNYINSILAEHASVTTPERRINDIFGLINDFFGDGDIVPFYTPNQSSMSLKSCLEYKYRPTMKYEVELYRSEVGKTVGQLDVLFRTTSSELLNKLVEFFRMWVNVERSILPLEHEYELGEGKFSRSISSENVMNHSSGEFAAAISGYVKLFDNSLKSYISGEKTSGEIGNDYSKYARNTDILI